MFKHFECFEPEVYYGIIASIIVISFVTSFHKRSLKSFLTTFWSYLSVILSDYFSLKSDTRIGKLIFTYSHIHWFMANDLHLIIGYFFGSTERVCAQT